MRSIGEGAGYWDAVSTRWQRDQGYGLWRRHSDAVNGAWVRRALPERRFGHLLRTDLFDEAFGDGLYPVLAGRAESVTGVDISAATVAAATRRHAGLRAVQADVRHLPFDDGVFDAIISSSTLDHFRTQGEIVAGLRELYRVLGRGGLLLLTLDNPANPAVALRNVLPSGLLNRLGIVPYYVGATCGPRRLREVLGAIGFEVRELATLLHCPRVLAVGAARACAHAILPVQRGLLRTLWAWERMAGWPGARITGHYLAVTVVKR